LLTETCMVIPSFLNSRKSRGGREKISAQEAKKDNRGNMWNKLKPAKRRVKREEGREQRWKYGTHTSNKQG